MSLSHRIITALPRINRLPRSFRSPTPLIARNYGSTPCLLRQADFRRDDTATTVTGEAWHGGDRDTETEIPTDSFSNLNVYGHIPSPGSAVETIYDDGFIFSNGVKFFDGSGALLVHNEAFKWRPTERGSEVEAKAISNGILELGKDVWGMLDVIHPKPELLIVGTGRKTLLLSKEDRSRITEMGIRMDVMDTTHAAAQYNLLATERSQGEIAAALMVDAFGEK